MTLAMASTRSTRAYGGQDPAEMPAYPIAEVAQFLWVRQKSLRRWASGESGRTPVIRIADRERLLLSFLNLAELHVLSFLRDQRVPLQAVRRSIDYLRTDCGLKDHPHPLLAVDIATDGRSVLIDEMKRAGVLVNISQHGQLVMRELLDAHLKRLERDASTKAALRLFPFAWKWRSPDDANSQPRPITIDPLVSAGRPVISGTRVPTVEIASRIAAGEPMPDVAKDMRLELSQVEAALRYHVRIPAA